MQTNRTTNQAQAPGLRRRRKDLRWVALAAAVPVTLLYLGATPASAAVFTLTSDDGFTTVTVNPASSAGMTSMTINTIANNVQQQGFWYRTGTGAIQPISNLTLSGATETYLGPGTSTKFDDLSLNYTGSYTASAGHVANFTLSVQYLMQDGGSTTGSLQELVSVGNDPSTGPAGQTSNITLPIDIFEYNQFTPRGDTSNEQVSIGPSDTNDVNAGAGYNDALQLNVANGSSVAEDNVTPTEAFYSLGLATNPATYFAGITGNLPGDSTVPLGSDPMSPVGNVQWVFEWTNDGPNAIAVGDSSPEISKLLSVTVPEPATGSLLIAATGALALRRPRRKIEGAAIA